MIFYGKTFAEKQLEQKGRKYDYDMRKARTVSAEFIDRLMREAHNEAIEQCARVAENFYSTPPKPEIVVPIVNGIARAIRALKDQK